jgi:hypothetical protein
MVPAQAFSLLSCVFQSSSPFVVVLVLDWAHSTRYRLLRAFDALPHAARVTSIRPFESAGLPGRKDGEKRVTGASLSLTPEDDWDRTLTN